jgi:hypothetical protein
MLDRIRFVAGAIAFALALRWLAHALRQYTWRFELRVLEAFRGRYGADPDTGLLLRILPLTPDERAAALKREADAAIAAPSVHL